MSTLIKSRDDGTREICIWSPGVTDTAIEMLDENIMDGTIIPEEFNRASLCYKKLASDNPTDPDEYPLKVYSEDGKTEVWISGITTGYRGTGPHGTVQALMLMGFEIDPERDVFTLPMGEEKMFEK